VSIDGGEHWVELKNNMPTVAFNDLVIHPRDNDLVLGTHGRGIWILDNIAPLQEMTPDVLASEAHLFAIEPAEMIRYTADRPAQGDMTFSGENPPDGAIIDYYLRDEPGEITLAIKDGKGVEITRLAPTRHVGVNRVIWNLRYPDLPVLETPGGRSRRAPQGPLVVPGTYLAELIVGGRSWTQEFQVDEDPRIETRGETRQRWTEDLLDIAALYRDVLPGAQTLRSIDEQVRESDGVTDDVAAEVKDLNRMYTELTSRIGRLYREVSGWVGGLTNDQQSQRTFYKEVHARMDDRKDTLLNVTLPDLNERLPQEQRIRIKP
jgi:hypothetical protein